MEIDTFDAHMAARAQTLLDMFTFYDDLPRPERAELVDLTPERFRHGLDYEAAKLLHEEQLTYAEVARRFGKGDAFLRARIFRHERRVWRWYRSDREKAEREEALQAEQRYLLDCCKTILRSRFTEVNLNEQRRQEHLRDR